MRLIVTSEFDGHAVGTEIDDPATVQAILADHRAAHVVKAALAEPAGHAPTGERG